jgi:hypothetical protein
MNDPYISDLPALLSNLAAPTSREAYAESEAKLQANYREPGGFTPSATGHMAVVDSQCLGLAQGSLLDCRRSPPIRR